MEFHEKLQELRKSRGLTQEELAEDLYVSRTAISKWESGRGYPSIDSLKEISKYFSVTIDDLLSGEKLLSIAEKENRLNLRNLCDLLIGVMDLSSLLLIVLPLYPNQVNGFIYSVNLLSYTQITSIRHLFYWIIFVLLLVVGMTKVWLAKSGAERSNQIVTGVSMVLSILGVLFLAITRDVYALSIMFMLLVMKGVLLLKYVRAVAL